MLEALDRIPWNRQQRGYKPPTEEEMGAEIAQMRAADDEYEERWGEIWSHGGTQPERTGNS